MSTGAEGEIDIDRLRGFLVSKDVAQDGSNVEARLLSGGKSNLTYFVRVDDAEYVLRRPPLGDYDPRAHDVGREFRILSALAPTGIPVPKVVVQDTTGDVIGAPFYLMVRIEGRVIESAGVAPDLHSPEAMTQLRDGMVDGLVSLHSIDPASVGLADLGKPQGYTMRQVSRWTRVWNEGGFRSIPALTEAGNILLATAERLPLDAEAPTIVHGDYNLGNMIIAPGLPPRVAAILDWEMATIGHPLMDLGLLVTYQSPLMGGIFERDDAFSDLPGFPPADSFAKCYAEKSGRSIELLDFFRSLALFKILVLTEQIRARHQAGNTRGEQFRNVGESVPGLAETLLSQMRGSPLLTA